ncbi:MAG TPA: hypothetical protein VEJ18_21510 [Planctomycetota bacterium]|nr:hypothetical protein [Planctomycetota bacterium]
MVSAFRYLGVLGLAFWLGGVAFYGGLVIPKAHEILSSHRDIGFVTREVTSTANVLGAIVLGLLFLHGAVAWTSLGKGARIALAASWVVMLAALAVLFLLHAHLDTMLDPAALQILDRPRFMPLHERYLNVTSLQTLAGLVHLWAMLRGPRPGVNPPPPAAR